ncbi:MAG: MFS transporter [Paracoccaceae bacterium]
MSLISAWVHCLWPCRRPVALGARRLLLGALALGAALSFVQAAMLPLPVMLASRVLEGLSHLVIVVAAPTLIARLAAPADRGLAMSLWSTFFGVTFALTAGLGPPLVARAGLGALVLVHALWMTGVLLALWRALPADPTVSLTQPAPSMRLACWRGMSRSTPRRAWRHPRYGLALLATLTWVSVLTVPAGLDRRADAGGHADATGRDRRVDDDRCLALAAGGAGGVGHRRLCTGRDDGACACRVAGQSPCSGRDDRRARAGTGGQFCCRASAECRPGRSGGGQWRDGADGQSGQHAGHAGAIGADRCFRSRRPDRVPAIYMAPRSRCTCGLRHGGATTSA